MFLYIKGEGIDATGIIGCTILLALFVFWISEVLTFIRTKVHVEGDKIRATYVFKKPIEISMSEITRIEFKIRYQRSTEILCVNIKSDKGVIETDHLMTGFAKNLLYLRDCYDRGLIPQKAVTEKSYKKFEDYYSRSPEGRAQIKKEKKEKKKYGEE